MSVRYTAANGMEQPALRTADLDVDRWRDKIELRLDNRQVFFLFFGSAVVACMLFVLGVMVGKRIESRGAAAAPEIQDPLTVLDRARQPAAGAAAADEDLTFPNTLMGGNVGKARTPAPRMMATAQVPKPVAPKPLPVVAAAPKPAASPIAAATKPPAPPVLPKVVAPPPAPPPESAKVRGKFTLQLSTFASQEEADNFARRYPGAFVIAGDVTGRGMAYRVRMGNYASFKEAATAKETFERQHKMIALVAAR